MSEMPREIYAMASDFDPEHQGLWVTTEGLRAPHAKYLRADTIAEASKRVSEYKADVSKYPMLEQTERAKKREQERAKTLDRAIKAMQRVVDDLNMRARDGVVSIGNGAWWELNEALTELKKLRGEV